MRPSGYKRRTMKKQTAFRMSLEMLAEIESHRKRMEQERRGQPVSTAESMRDLLACGLEVAKKAG